MSRYDAIPDALVTADLGEGVGVQPVADWSVSRQMSGGGLPGQARGASGSSVGSGSVTVHSPAGRSPWTAGPIRPGGTVALDARADTAAPMSPVARMVARDVSGSASSRALSVAIEDDIEALRAPQSFMVPPRYLGAPLDASGVIYALAARAGYHAVPPPVASALIAVPLAGVWGETFPAPSMSAPASGGLDRGVRYVEYDGQVGVARPAGSDVASWANPYWIDMSRTPAIDAPVYTTFEYVYLVDGGDSQPTFLNSHLGDMGFEVAITSSLLVRVVAGGYGPWVTAPGASPAARKWERVQVQAEWLSVSGDTAGGARIRARVGPTGAWSGWSTVTGSRTIGPSLHVQAELGRAIGLRGVQMHTEDDPAVWARPTARIGLSGSTLTAALPAPARSAWETMQEIARATLGWVGIDADGALVYRGRDALRGGTPTETIISEESLEEVPWSISADDVADRVEVTYRPAALLTTEFGSNPTYTVWESTELIGIPPGRPAVIDAQIDGLVARIASWWLPVWLTGEPAEAWSRWNAFPNPDGTGAQPASDALAFDTRLLSSDRVRITITNRTTNPLWVTQLTLRAYITARAGEPLTVSRGAPADTARSLLTYDLGTWVQDDAIAREILDWLAGTTSEPLPTLTGVRVIPDASRRLGQIVKVADRTTSLAAKALITGISMTGSDGALTQNLDLTILATTFNDIDTWLTREALTTFDLLDARLTALGLTTFDKLDDYLTRLGGIL